MDPARAFFAILTFAIVVPVPVGHLGGAVPEDAAAQSPELSESLYIEAEDFAGPWRLQTNYPGYSGLGFRVSNARGVAASELRTEIRVPRAGEYAVWARGLASPQGKRGFSVAVGSARFPATHRDSPKTAFRWERCGSAKIEAGSAEIVIRDEEEGYECPDAVFLTKDRDAPPPDPAAQLDLGGEASPEAIRRANLERFPALLSKVSRGLPETKEAWLERRAKLAPELCRLLGLDPEPERSPLEARIVGVLEREGYRVEKIVFESRPGFLVTANLYLPAGPSAPKGPLPTVLCPVGHWGLSKAEPIVQSRAASLARLGFAAFVYDPLGQGERAVPGNEHSVAHIGALVGESNMTYMIWDSVRALDYLETRPEVDPGRFGCTGCSGGGLNTMYLSAFEAARARSAGRSRIRAAAPVGYVCTFASFLGTGITHCPCSHVPGIGDAMDMDEVLGLFAPGALLVVGGKRDPMFTEAGMREAHEGIAALYRLSGASRPPELFFDDCGHDYSRPMRERAYGFFLRELLGRGDGSAVPEPLEGWKPESPEALFCFPGGRVPESGATYRSLVEARLARKRGKDPRAVVEALSKALPIAGGEWRELDVPLPESAARRGLRARILVDPEGFRSRVLAAEGSAELRLILIEENGLTHGTLDSLAALRDETGATVVALEPPLWREEGSARHLALTNGLLLGRHPAALAVRALLAEAARHPRSGVAGNGGTARTAILARGRASSVAALIALLLSEEIGSAAALYAPASWLDLFEPGTAREEGLLPRAGFAGEIVDLLRAAPPKAVLWTGAEIEGDFRPSVEVRRAVPSLEEAASWLTRRAPR